MRSRSAALRRGIVVFLFVFVRLAGRLNCRFFVGQEERPALPAGGQRKGDQGGEGDGRKGPTWGLCAYSIHLLGAGPGLIHYTA